MLENNKIIELMLENNNLTFNLMTYQMRYRDVLTLMTKNNG
jgi:hypothetical protein